ncbi:unnamed protein product, partial [Mesorhabditis belari]|uniref:Serum response factor homolog n=1 Tax=Mesorhabditis belari TaxID=2138241 RepID=A0AAF3J307_9BILA
MSLSPDLPTSATTAVTTLLDLPSTPGMLPNGKKTKGRVKIKMEYIGNKLRRYTTFSKRKTGIMKKAYELSTLTGTQVMLLVASETGHVYTFATKKLQPMISSDAGKALIQSCLNAADDGENDCVPHKTEFTFDNGQINGNRKRKANEAPSPDQMIGSFLPTMVPNSLFTNFNEEEYNPDDSDDSDSEEGVELKDVKEEIKEIVDEHKEKEKALALQKTLKEALKAAANNRQQQQNKKKKIEEQQRIQSITHQQLNNALLAPFLLGATTSNGNTVLQLPQGIVTLEKVEQTNEGATAASGGLFIPKTAEEAVGNVNPMLLQSMPFLNFQQFIESASAMKNES